MKRREFLRNGVAASTALAADRFIRPLHAAPKNDQITLKCVSTWGSASEFDRKLAAEFMEANPNIRIEFAALGKHYDRQKVEAQQAGDPFDLWITGSFYSMWATQMGYTIDPEPLYRRDFGPDYKSLFFDEFVRWQGKMVGVLTSRSARVFYYNKDIIEAAGLSLPHEDWTWDDFFRIATGTLERDAQGDIVQWGCTVYETDLFRFYISLEGQSMFSADYRQATIDTPVGHDAASAIHDLAFKHRAMGERAHWRVTEDVATSWNHGAFNAGKVALLLADDGRIKPAHERADAAGFRLGVAPLPRRKRNVAGFENMVYQIWKSPDPARTEAAWKFAKSYLTRENQVRTMIEEGFPPVRRDAYDDPAAVKFQQQWPDVQVAHNAYEHGRFDARIAAYPTMALEYVGVRPHIYQMMMQKLTPEDAVKQMQTKCQQILDKFWAKADQGTYELFPEELHK